MRGTKYLSEILPINKIIESNKQYFINTYGYIDTHKFSGMQYIVDNYKEKGK